MARFPWKVVAASGLALGALGAGLSLAQKRDEKRRHAPKRIALIGDSYAVGLGPELEKIFPEFRAEGHQGTNTAQWAAHAKACGECGDWLPTFKPDVVLVALGVNDGKTPNISNYQTIVRGLHGLGAHVVWIEPPAEVDAPAVRDAINSLGVTTVPATRVSVASDKLHLHPSVAGYQTWATEVLQTLGRNDLLPLLRTTHG